MLAREALENYKPSLMEKSGPGSKAQNGERNTNGKGQA